VDARRLWILLGLAALGALVLLFLPRGREPGTDLGPGPVAGSGEQPALLEAEGTPALAGPAREREDERAAETEAARSPAQGAQRLPSGEDAAKRERRFTERLAELDQRAARHGEAALTAGRTTPKVAAVMNRRHAASMRTAHDYRVATFSFEKDTRDDVEGTRNDWDFVLSGYGGTQLIDVTTVTDDRSLIRDLGPIDFDAALRGDFLPGEGAEAAEAILGHLYVIHTLDTESDHWVLMRIVEMTPGEDMVFEWVIVKEPGPLEHALVAASRDLQAPFARLQLRSGHGGGNPHRVFLDGTKNAYLPAFADEPLDLAAPLPQGERGIAFAEGGLVPRDQAFRIEEILLRVGLEPDRGGRCEALVQVGAFPVLSVGTRRDEATGESTLRVFSIDRGVEHMTTARLPLVRSYRMAVPIVRNAESSVFIEGASWSRVGVELRGRLVPVQEAGAVHPWNRHQQRQALSYLERAATGEGVGLQGRWISGLPGAEAWLLAIRDAATDPDYGARLDAVLEALPR
jgi:hypothetical protein